MHWSIAVVLAWFVVYILEALMGESMITAIEATRSNPGLKVLFWAPLLFGGAITISVHSLIPMAVGCIVAALLSCANVLFAWYEKV